MVGYGTVVPDGSLPVFSVDTEKQARTLLVAACSTNMQGEFVATELVTDQSLENLDAFSDRLAEMAERINLFGDADGTDDESGQRSSSGDSQRRLPGRRRRAKKSKSRGANTKRAKRG